MGPVDLSARYPSLPVEMVGLWLPRTKSDRATVSRRNQTIQSGPVATAESDRDAPAMCRREGMRRNTEMQARNARLLWDDYDLVSKAQGSNVSGNIRQAKHGQTGRQVTMKISACPDARKVALSALQVHRDLDHEHIVRLEDVYVSICAIHMIMEHLEGGNLSTALAKRGRFSEDDAKVVLRQLLQAVDYLHQRSIVHRDIKLESIMFARVGGTNIKLIDFGLATEWDGITEMSPVAGMVDFSSPEMWRGMYTEKVDLWSIGVVAYMLLTGQPLYQGSDWEICTQAKAGRPLWCERLHTCSAAARDFVASLLEREPEQRISAGKALCHPWLR